MSRIRCRARSSARQGLYALPAYRRLLWTPSTQDFLALDHLLDHALKAAQGLGAETRLIKLNNLTFRHCEGYYSKAAQACTWPCSITQMDAKDQMEQIYEVLVHWADVIIISSPIRWGAASSLYFKMAERLNCVQNAVMIRNQVLILTRWRDLLLLAVRTISKRSRVKCWAFSRSLVLYFHNSPISPIRVVGRMKTWNATSRLYATPKSLLRAHLCSPSAVSTSLPI